MTSTTRFGVRQMSDLTVEDLANLVVGSISAMIVLSSWYGKDDWLVMSAKYGSGIENHCIVEGIR